MLPLLMIGEMPIGIHWGAILFIGFLAILFRGKL